ncbi:unnamed protein product, partial [Mesorhabditis belari]|uniref:L-type lectin-like domain-containing protein n=1 Tax=Mesorhabditis belari TaxID=2138241 RepID=A0AAF3J7N8_9BILA
MGTSEALWGALVCCLFVSTIGQAPTFKRFEYKHSFRAPNLAQRDGSIPFWTVAGDAIASQEQLRLAPSMRSRKGIAWNKRSFVESENFQVDVALKVSGQGRIGADGMGLWYTATPGTLGPVFGANDFWTGMGLFFDSFDNDGQKNNPMISLMINDGTRSYDHHTDGSQQILSSCQRDFRNKPFPIRVRIEYFKNVLTVHVDDGMSQVPRYELCIRAENIFLPRNGYFGASAATGGLADDHDVTDFSVYSLFQETQKPAAEQQLPQAEKAKYDEEFQKQMEEYEKERQRYKEEHPDKAKDDEEDEYGKYFEDATARELRLIYESQTAIHKVMQQMEQKLIEIRQGQVSGGVAVPQQQQQHTGSQHVAAGQPSFAVHEKNEVIQTLRDLTASLRDMKNYVNEIFTKTYNIEQKIGSSGGAVASGGAGGGQADVATQQRLDRILAELNAVRANQGASGSAGSASCPDVPCASTSLFLGIIFVQSAVIIGVIFLRSKPEKSKFY